MASALPVFSGEESFQSRLDAKERFTQAQLLTLVAAVGDELREAHAAKRFHGAITPLDIHYGEAGEISLDGWGRDTAPNAMQDSPYAPIECYVPVHPQGPWTDVYALAAILWRAITGEAPALVLHRKGEVTLERLAPSGYDPAFLRAVDAALVVAPQRRPRDIDHWLAMLADRQPASAERTAALADAPPPRTRRRPWPVAALAAGIVAAIGGGIYLGSPADPVPPPPSRRSAVAPPAIVAQPPVVTVEAAPPAIEELPATDPIEIAAGVEPRDIVPPPVVVATEVPVPAPARVAPPIAPQVAPQVAPIPARSIPAQPIPAPVEVAQAEATPSVVEAPAAIEPPVALLARADARLRPLYTDYEKLNVRLARSYRNKKIANDVKLRRFDESQRIRAALFELREDRNRIAQADSFATANRRYEVLAEDATLLRDRMEILRRSL